MHRQHSHNTRYCPYEAIVLRHRAVERKQPLPRLAPSLPLETFHKILDEVSCGPTEDDKTQYIAADISYAFNSMKGVKEQAVEQADVLFENVPMTIEDLRCTFIYSVETDLIELERPNPTCNVQLTRRTTVVHLYGAMHACQLVAHMLKRKLLCLYVKKAPAQADD